MLKRRLYKRGNWLVEYSYRIGYRLATETRRYKRTRSKSIGLIVSDNLTGLNNAIPKVYKTQHQKCVVHFIRNVLAQVHPKHKQPFADYFKEIFNLNIIVDTPKAVKTGAVQKNVSDH